VGAVILAGDGCRLPRLLAAAIERLQVPVTWLAADTSAAPPVDVRLDAVFYPRQHSVQEVARALLTLASRRTAHSNRIGPAPLRRLAAAAAERSSRPPAPFWVRHLASRIESVDDLRRSLGSPKTILCLGSGPSSGDHELLAEKHDALFRVDHAWAERGLLSQPHVVFTGTSETLSSVRGPVFGLANADAIAAMMAARLLRIWQRPAKYFLPGSIADPYREFAWRDHRPSPDALMIATAVALIPRRLVIAGIDVFSRSRTAPSVQPVAAAVLGRLSDDDRERTYILGCLDRHVGEIVLFDEGLKAAVARRRQGLV
jgi:hypothetical protein